MPRSGSPMFVVHRHRAPALVRYSLRLEADGVLKSWSLAIGLPTELDDARVALRVEDYPMEYQSFEGIIPEGEHNAGEVMVWDTGPYVNLSRPEGGPLPIGQAIAAGEVVVGLAGLRLQGRYVLSRHHGDGREAWLIRRVPREAGMGAADEISI